MVQHKGKVEILTDDAKPTIILEGNEAKLTIGGKGKFAKLILARRNGKTSFFLKADLGIMVLGGNGANGYVLLKSGDGKERFHLDAQSAAITLGGRGADGKLELRGKHQEIEFATSQGYMNLGDCNYDGKMFVRRGTDGQETIILDGKHGAIWAGVKKGTSGKLYMMNTHGKPTISLYGGSGRFELGGNGVTGYILLYNSAGKGTIRLYGSSGRIVTTGDVSLQGADCSEEFDVSESGEIDAGTVLVIDEVDKLRPCDKPYDKKVAGVVSGGNSSNPGIILGKRPSQNKRMPIALNGKVYCKVDAQFAPIEIGDLLTTSPTVGHAMKVSDPCRAFGAVIGKALGSLRESKGLIPILVALQ